MSSQFLCAQISAFNLKRSLNELDKKIREIEDIEEIPIDLIEQFFDDGLEDEELLEEVKDTLLDDINECLIRIPPTDEHCSDYSFFKVFGHEVMVSGGFSYGDSPCDFFDSLCRIGFVMD